MTIHRYSLLTCTTCGQPFGEPSPTPGYKLREQAKLAGWAFNHAGGKNNDFCPECIPTNGEPTEPAKAPVRIVRAPNPAPLEDFGLALQELREASDKEIAEIAAMPLRGKDKSRVKAARAVQQERAGRKV